MVQRVSPHGRDVSGETAGSGKSRAAHDIRVVLFDLDDTLYPETQYVRSGFLAVSRAFGTAEFPPEHLFTSMCRFCREDRAHVFDCLAASLMTRGPYSRYGSTSELAAQMIECYRHHEPRIHLYSDAAECLEVLRDLAVRVGVVTDGTWSVQERKVRALNLCESVDLVIFTDKLAPDRRHWKPSAAGFEVAAKHFDVPAHECCYVGDNAAKDFDGPAALGMTTVWVRRPDGLYNEDRPGHNSLGGTRRPTCELSDLRQLPELLWPRGPTP